MKTGTVFDIREFTVHDGPGCRVTFFLKGCPLRCVWCHNPEGQRFDPEIMVKSALCTHCGNCLKDTEHPDYRCYGRNPSACPNGLISISGMHLSPQDVWDRVEPMKHMLRMMEGGVTFSGGEPLSQPEFLLQSLKLLRENGVHTAIETCGFASREIFESVVLAQCDYVMMDLKLMDDAMHQTYTGVSNRMILENARALMDSGVAFEFRTPLIPGITDTEENLSATKAFIGDAKWEKLPYNTLAGAKYPMLGREYPYDTKI